MLAVVAAFLTAAVTPFTLVSGDVDFEITAPLDTIHGTSRSVKGTVTLDPDNWTAASSSGAPLARVEIDLESFKTGIDLRDLDLREQFFETDKHKTAVLTITALERPSTLKLEKGTTAEAFARATLELHGVSSELIFPIKVVYDDTALSPDTSRESLGVSAAFVVPLEQFAMKRPQRLIFKLGKDVRVVVRGRLRGPAPTTTTATAVREVAPPLVVARKPPELPKPSPFAFKPDTPAGKGERLFADPSLGAAGNVVTCASCHGVHDERLGLLEVKSKTVPPASSLWGVSRRPTWWRGIGRSPGHAASICARMFMLRKDNLPQASEDLVAAYLAAISKDPLPAHDYAAALLAKEKDTPTTTAALPAGDGKRGFQVVQRTCVRCHGKGQMRPELTPGLYDKALIVSRVRGLKDGDALQMPAYALDRLTDSELADVVAFLADEKQRIFMRK
ncbi:MAG: YceI family protein [Deltaproteobacteria bacterium]|nr:YceI family protein [Deltaproteobacteria bacterium]